MHLSFLGSASWFLIIVVVVHSLSRVHLFVKPWTATHCTKLPCPSSSLRDCSNSCPSKEFGYPFIISSWCHPVLFLPSNFPSMSFPMSQFFTSVGQSIGDSASVSILPVNIHGWFPLELTDLTSLSSKKLKRLLQHISKASVLQHSAFFTAQLSHPATGLEKVSFHSNPRERQCRRMFKLPHNCTHFTSC